MAVSLAAWGYAGHIFHRSHRARPAHAMDCVRVSFSKHSDGIPSNPSNQFHDGTLVLEVSFTDDLPRPNDP